MKCIHVITVLALCVAAVSAGKAQKQADLKAELESLCDSYAAIIGGLEDLNGILDGKLELASLDTDVCGSVENIDGATSNPTGSSFNLNDVVTYSCDAGKILIGKRPGFAPQDKIICKADGTWSDSNMKCVNGLETTKALCHGNTATQRRKLECPTNAGSLDILSIWYQHKTDPENKIYDPLTFDKNEQRCQNKCKCNLKGVRGGFACFPNENSYTDFELHVVYNC